MCQLSTALAVDAASVMLHGLSNMLTDPESEIFRTFRRGQVYNNGTRGLQCRTGPPVPWVHGPAILNSFLAVSCPLHSPRSTVGGALSDTAICPSVHPSVCRMAQLPRL